MLNLSIQKCFVVGYVTISCREPVTGRPTGQLVMDYLTDAILSTRPSMIGNPSVSPDSQLITTVDHRSDGVTLALQKVTGGIDNFNIFSIDSQSNLFHSNWPRVSVRRQNHIEY